MTSPRSNMASQPSSPNNSQAVRPPLRPEDVCGGCVIWLPKSSVSSSIRCTLGTDDHLLPKGCYGHPFVVLRVEQAPGSAIYGDLVVTIAMVTTFGCTPLITYLSNRSSTQYSSTNSIPILQTSSSVQFPFPALTLEKNVSLPKQSYVILQNAYTAPLTALRTVGFSPRSRAYNERLSRTSHSKLMALFNLQATADDYPKTDTLSHTAVARLQQLSQQNAGSQEESGSETSEESTEEPLSVEDWARAVELHREDYERTTTPVNSQLATPTPSPSPTTSTTHISLLRPSPFPNDATNPATLHRSHTTPIPTRHTHTPNIYPTLPPSNQHRAIPAASTQLTVHPRLDHGSYSYGYGSLPGPTPNSWSGRGKGRDEDGDGCWSWGWGWKEWVMGLVVVGVVIAVIVLKVVL